MTNQDESPIFFELWDSKGRSIVRHGDYDVIPSSFNSSWNDNFEKDGLRNAYRKTDRGSVRLVIDTKNPAFQGKASIVRACAIYLTLIPKFEQIEAEQRKSFDVIIRRFAHNLIKFQTRFKDNFQRLVSDKSRARPYSEFKDEVKRRIEENTSSAANDVCELSHRAIDLDAQIETLRIIAGYADGTGSFLPANLKKAMYRLTNPFLDELEKRNIRVLFNIDANPSGAEKVKVVDSLFNAAIWQLLDNASKYVLHDTDINITADLQSRPQKMFITMTSVCIDKDELEDIFLENFRGRHTKNTTGTRFGINGTGIGLFIVRKALGFMNSHISVTNNHFVKNDGGHRYCEHTFTIEFSTE